MLAKEVLARSAVLLNDKNQAIFTNADLLPHLQTAYDELVEMLEENNVPITNVQSSNLTVTTSMTDIGGPTGPALPLDLVEIQTVWERLAGSAEDFVIVERRNYLPTIAVLTTDLQYWVPTGLKNVGIYIKFLGALTNREVKLDYISNTGNTIDTENSYIGIDNAKTNLAYRTAALAALFIGEDKDRHDVLTGYATGAFERLINISVKGQQAVVTRRRPFRSNYKRRSL